MEAARTLIHLQWRIGETWKEGAVMILGIVSWCYTLNHLNNLQTPISVYNLNTIFINLNTVFINIHTAFININIAFSFFG